MHDDTALLKSILVKFCLERIGRFEDFEQAETSAHDDVLKTLADAMSEALEVFDERLFADRPEGWRVKDARSRSILTEFGEVTFTRRVYIDEFGDRRTYLDEIVSLRPRKRLSPSAFGALVLFGSEIPYERAARMLFRHCAGDVSGMTTMGALRETGDLLEAQAEVRRRELFDEGLLPSASRMSEELRVEADGIWVALQRARGRGVEVKALCAYEDKNAGRRVGVVHHALVGGPKRFWEEGVAHLGRPLLAALLEALLHGKRRCEVVWRSGRPPARAQDRSQARPLACQPRDQDRLPRATRLRPAVRPARRREDRRAARCAHLAPGHRFRGCDKDPAADRLHQEQPRLDRGGCTEHGDDGGDPGTPLRRPHEGVGRGMVQRGGERHGAHQGHAGLRRRAAGAGEGAGVQSRRPQAAVSDHGEATPWIQLQDGTLGR